MAPTRIRRRTPSRRSGSSATISPGASPAWADSGTTSRPGVNFLYEPHLFATFNSGVDDYFYIHLTDERNGPIQTITRNGGTGDVNIPFKQYAAYLQDDWRVSNRLTLNLGLRYDLVLGVQIDQSQNPNFVALQAAGAAGRFTTPGMTDWGKSPQEDRNNIQPRAGFAYDVRGNGRDVIRGGWGIYQDFGYTNSNVLFAAIDASGQGHGPIFAVNNTTGIRKPDGTLFRVGDPISSIAAQNEADPTRIPLFGQVVAPRMQQPYTRQTNIGWAHQLSGSTALTVDAVHIEGRDLNVRFRYNYLDPATGVRRLSGLDIRPNTQGIRLGISGAESLYNGLIVGLRRRMTQGLDLAASYTLGSATSNMGTASDELDANYVQDVADPFADVQLGPSGRSDARHRLSASAVVRLPWGFQVAPFFVFRSALPIFTFEGVDRNHDGNNNDITVKAYQYRRAWQSAEGDRRLRSHQLQPRGAADPAERSRLEVVPGDRECAARSDRRSVQCLQRAQPGVRADQPAPCRRRSACRLPATGRVCRRLPPIRAAHRPGGVQVYVLTGSQRNRRGPSLGDRGRACAG